MLGSRIPPSLDGRFGPSRASEKRDDMSRFLAPVLATLLALAAALPAAAGIDLDAIPPMDSEVLHGVLPNGLSYYIRANEKPEDRVELRLAVRVGSVQETDE